MDSKKICSGCKEEKSIDNFHRLGDGYQYICKTCRKENDASRYEQTRPPARRRARPKGSRKELIEWFRTLKDSTPCTDCGHKFHFAAVDFDHLSGVEKIACVGALVQTGSRAEVETEIAKCELVCSNCHRIRTFNRWCEKARLSGHPIRGWKV